MGSKRALNARNLEALGAERLAELLIEISQDRTVARRLLRLELAGRAGTAELAREVRQRLGEIGRQRAVIDSRKGRDLVDELAIHRTAIVDRIAGEDAADRSSATTPHAFSRVLYRMRNRVERFFNKLKQFRRIATR